MERIVCKFGGSNFKDSQSIERIIEVMQRYQNPLVVVVSAFYGVTNQLLEAIDRVQHDEAHIQKLIDSIREKKLQALETTITDSSVAQATQKELEERLGELQRYLTGIHYIGELPHSVKDQILSYGERLSSLMLTKTLQSRGMDAMEALPEDIGLLTDGAYQNATVNIEGSAESIQAALGKHQIYVIPGFYGISPQGKVNLLGRGGSDYSAAAIAAALEAKSLDVWKDVNGYLSADPKLVEGAKKISHLSYSEAAELSYFGARILHPRTVEPLMDGAIPIRIFNIEAPGEGITPLTEISRVEVSAEHRDMPIRSVTYSDDFAILRLSGPGVGMKPGILGKVTGQLDRKSINIKSVVTSQTAINFYLDRLDLENAVEALNELTLPAVHRITSIDDLSMIALVGHGLNSHSRTLIRIAETLEQLKITTEILSLGAAEGTAYFAVPAKERERAVQAIHRRFFGE